MITTRTDLADKMSRIVDHGRNDMLESIEIGTNLRMSLVSAAIGRIQLKHLEEWTTKRRKNANSIKHQTKIRTDLNMRGINCVFKITKGTDFQI